ncbi:MAG: hypothetical protein ABRQ39_26480 [Candidatus Eremiobacterota bacterium]
MKKQKSNGEKGAAMLLALFTVIILAAIATGFLAIVFTESKTTDSRIDSELALQAATEGLQYLALVATAEPNCWTYAAAGGANPPRNGNFSQLNTGNNTYFAQNTLGGGGFYLVYNMFSTTGNTKASNRFLLGDETSDGKLVGCRVLIYPDPNRYPDIVAKSIGYVVNGSNFASVDLDNSATVFYATRAVQAVLKEISHTEYAYIYRNFTDLDLPFNVPAANLADMQNMVGLCPNTIINGGVRADGIMGDTDATNNIGRIIFWDANCLPIDSVTDPNKIAKINGPVRLASQDQYNASSSGSPDGNSFVVRDSQIGDYYLSKDIKGPNGAFQGSSTVLGAQQRGVPGANTDFMGNIRSSTSAGSATSGNPYATMQSGLLTGLAIDNTDIRRDQESTAANREDLDHDGKADYSKNICKLTFSVDNSTPPVKTVKVDVYNRYEGAGGKDSSNINNIMTEDCRIGTSKTYTLGQDAVIYVGGGNVMVEGEIGTGVTVVADDSRTATNSDVNKTIDELLPDPNSYGDPAQDTAEDQAQFFRSLEKDNLEGTPTSEGNIFISGDIKYRDGTTSAAGLISENYMYLHELHKTANPGPTDSFRELNVRAQLNSIRQSVQFDFFNYLGEGKINAGDSFDYFTNGAGSANFKGSFNFRGQMVGKQTDVEGDGDGRGYAHKMSIGYDESLKYYTAPQFFNENYQSVPSGELKFAITAFFDSGSLGVKK